MKELLPKFVDLEKTLSEEKRGLSLFALFLREDAVDKWDLVLAAPWIDLDRKGALSYITKKVQETFTPDELSFISRIVLIDLENPAVEAVNQAVAIRHGQAEVRDSNFFGLQIKHAYIIHSERRQLDQGILA